MTAIAPTQTPTPVPAVGRPSFDKSKLHITFGRVFRFEWLKLVSLRSTWITLAAIFAIIVGLGIIGPLVAGKPAAGATGVGLLSTVLLGSNIAVLVIGVLGALIGAREYSSGMIRASISAVPKRLPVLWGKSLAFFALLVPTVLLGVIGAYTFGELILAGNGAPTASLSDTGVVRVLLGTVAYLAGLGIIGLCLGILLRSVAGGIAVLLGAVIFLPQIAGFLLPSSWHHILKFLPSNAGSSFTSITPASDGLSADHGMIVFAIWIVIALASTAVALRSRDA